MISWKDVGYAVIVLVVLNLLDVVSTVYAINVLGFVELNSLAAGFPVWILVLKFSVCFIPGICAYALHKLEMEKHLLWPFVTATSLVEFYALVVAFNVYNILAVVTRAS